MDTFLDLCSEESVLLQERRRKIQSLLENELLDPGKRSNEGWYPIHYATKFGRADIVQLLLSHERCDPHMHTKYKRYTALHIASEHKQVEVVETLLQHTPDGSPARGDREGNTPLHVACRSGSLEIVTRLTNKYSTNSIQESNRAGSTPLGIAVTERRTQIARFLMSQKQAVGNPGRTFQDFRAAFPSFKYKHSLDHPVSIFVMGNRQTGKSTLIKSIQIEGYINRTIGAFRATSGVEYHSGGIVPHDVSSSGYGRAKFYELASCQQSTQENIFLSLEKSPNAIFIITLSFKQELKEMEATLFYWLCFIHNQYKSVELRVQPNVAVVGSFLFYQRPLRLDNRHRLHLVYHRVLSAHSELCSQFHFIGKFSMDCRLSESPGMHQLRGVLRRKSRELRPSGGVAKMPSSCYVLLSAMHEMRPAESDLPVLRLSEIEQKVGESPPFHAPLSLLHLLPTNAQDLQPLLDILAERKAIIVLGHLNHRDPWVIFDEYRLISLIDSTLIQRALRLSVNSLFNPGIMAVEKLLACLSPLSTMLSEDILLNILHHFKITEVVAHGNDTKYFLPSILNISPSSDTPPLSWNPDDSNYTLGFAQCILPQSKQVAPFFMPRFLYFMLYELFASTENSDFDPIIMTDSSLHLQLEPQVEIYVTIDSSVIMLNMRCAESGVFSCLQYRSRFEAVIHQQRELLQPNLKVTEYIVPMEGLSLPITTVKQIHKYGIQVSNLKNILTTKSSSSTSESMTKFRSFEPYGWLSKLQKGHLEYLLDPRLTNVEVTKAFIRDLAKCVGENWKKLLEYSELLQETSTSSEEPETEESSSDHTRLSQNQPTYGGLLDLFFSMSIFQTKLELISALKEPKEYENVSTSNDSTSEQESAQIPTQQRSVQVMPEDTVPKAESLSYLPASSSSSSVSAAPVSNDRSHVAYNSGQDISQSDGVTLKTCSTSSDASSIASMGIQMNVPNIQVGKAIVPMNDLPQNVQFISDQQLLKCGVTGGRFEDDIHKITFTIPPQAVRESANINIEYAVAVIGNFTFPEGITPVSPILWLRVKRESSNEKLCKPLEIGIPHAVFCEKNSKLLQILCAQDHSDSYSFTRRHKMSRILPDRGILRTKLSKQQYFFCIAAKTCREMVARTQYCIVKVVPKHPFDYSWKLYFFITYALPACVEMVKKQFGVEYMVEETGFQFDTSVREEPCITVEYKRMTPEQWTLTKEGTYRQIEASKVELGNLRSYQMNMMNRYHMYPPNFTITVSGQQATESCFVEFVFKGVVQTELLYEMALTLPRKTTLVSVSSTVDDGTTDTDTEVSLITQKREDDHLKESIGLGSRSSPVSLSWSVRSEPVAVIGRLRVGSEESGGTTPRNRSIRDQEKQSAMTVLIDNFNNIRKHLDNSAIRGELVQLRALTTEEAKSLLDSANMSDANERLIYILKKGGVNGFKQFMIALEKTSEEYQGHREILQELKDDLKQVEPHSRSATHILGSISPFNRDPRQKHNRSISLTK